MKRSKSISQLLMIILVALLAAQLTGCSFGVSDQEAIKDYQDQISKLQEENEELSAEASKIKSEYEEKIKKLEEDLNKAEADVKEAEASAKEAEANAEAKAAGVIVVPEYTGNASVAINDGVPFFSEEDLTTTGESYADLDAKGRCGVCIALVGPETLPTGSRESIGDIKPSGWDTVKYDGIDGNYLYNRCHLIGWQLTGENANTKNLITGTRYMNTQGMEPIETKVAKYVESTGNHVLYRSTPIFTGDNLLAAGVLIEALSIEDDTIKINEFCYNVQPNVTIDYATGKSDGPVFIGTETETETEIPSEQVGNRQEAVPVNEEQATEQEETEESKTVTYVGNSNSHKFHKPGCSSVDDMKDRNKVFFYGDRQEVIDAGYKPCQRCNP